MKKYIITLVIALGLGLNLCAQSDSFFNYSDGESKRNVSWETSPALPAAHGLDDHQNAAPIGGGVVLLAAMGLAYGIRRRIEN